MTAHLLYLNIATPETIGKVLIFRDKWKAQMDVYSPCLHHD